MERHACLRNRVGVCEWRRHRGGVLAQVDSEPRYHVAVRTPDRSRCSRRYNAGSTSRVSSVEDTMPPITTVASGSCPSAPVPTFRDIGTKPRLATRVDITTGRNRDSAMPTTAHCSEQPQAPRLRTHLHLTEPVGAAHPDTGFQATQA